METTYSSPTTAKRRTRTSHRYGGGRHRRSVALAPREKRRLLQLCVCGALFLVVFFGRGVFPDRLDAVRQDLLRVIRTDTDFTAAFASLGRSISDGKPVTDTLGQLWVDVFAGGKVTTTFADPQAHAPIYHEEVAYALSQPDAAQMAARRFPFLHLQPTQTAAEPAPAEVQQPEEGVLPAQPQRIYTGPPLPDNATMDRLPLGLDATAAPVMAVVSSGYGWREHPIEGGEKFHAGADLAAPYGDPVGAFADGVVDYIGESPAYGQYLQLKHAGGVTSFYAHCSKLCVQPGQKVVMGEKVAEVGDTGEATGPHLHFELKLNGELLNPLYYIETE